MADYIDREKLLDCIDLLFADDGTGYFVVTGDDINRIPAEDIVKVIRCKDCAYSSPNPRRENQRWCEVHMGMVYDDEFCSRGVKKNSAEPNPMKKVETKSLPTKEIFGSILSTAGRTK